VERAPVALKALRANLAALAVERASFRVYAGSVAAYLRSPDSAGPEQGKNQVVFLDPPYDAGPEYETALGLLGAAGARLLAADAVVVAEHRRKETLAPRYGPLKRTRLLEQGDAALSFYQADAGS
jgi:16S rRNA (guanine966-N2)-methyltransferase